MLAFECCQKFVIDIFRRDGIVLVYPQSLVGLLSVWFIVHCLVHCSLSGSLFINWSIVMHCLVHCSLSGPLSCIVWFIVWFTPF